MKKKEESGFLQSRSLWLSFALGVFLFLEGEELEKVVSKYIPFGVQSPSSAQMAAPPQEKQELEEQEPVPIIYVDNRVELTQELDKIYKHVQENVQYPPEAKRRHIQGTVLVRFVLKKDGTIGEVEVLRGDNLGDGALAEEVIRVLKSTSGWKTAKHLGRPVDEKLTMPITFKLK